MGLKKRTLTFINRFSDNYKTELWLPIIEEIKKLSNKNMMILKRNENYCRPIKASVMFWEMKKELFLQYFNFMDMFLRRLIRRAVRYAKMIDINENFTSKLSDSVIKIYKKSLSRN